MRKVEDGKRPIPKGFGDEPGEERSIWSTCSSVKDLTGTSTHHTLQTPGDLVAYDNEL